MSYRNLKCEGVVSGILYRTSISADQSQSLVSPRNVDVTRITINRTDLRGNSSVNTEVYASLSGNLLGQPITLTRSCMKGWSYRWTGRMKFTESVKSPALHKAIKTRMIIR